MLPFDATTLLLVNAVFNGFAALVWALLAGVFRIAPIASGLLAGAHLLTLPALLRSQCLAPLRPALLGPGLPELAGVLASALLCLGVRRLLRLRWRWLDVLALCALAAALILLGPSALVASAVAALAMGLLAALACRDLLVGMGPQHKPWISALLALPLLGLAAVSLLRGLSWVWWGAPPWASGCGASSWLAWVWLLLSLSITLVLLTLVLRRLIARIEQLTLTDPLTGALNRRAVARRLQELQSQAQRGHAYSVLLIDIDHFKRINDGMGHAAGDAALLHVVGQLRAGLRAGLDDLGRLGGEEFCALLPQTGLATAALVAERMRQRLQDSAFHWQGVPLHLTASFGAALGRPEDGGGEAALALADVQLYRAKAQGRNRVCVDRLADELS